MDVGSEASRTRCRVAKCFGEIELGRSVDGGNNNALIIDLTAKPKVKVGLSKCMIYGMEH